MRVLITNPPWIVRDGYTIRSGVRAGSRWPFTQVKHNILYEALYKIKQIFGIQISKSHHGYIPYPGFMGYATTFLQANGIDAVFYDAIALQDDYNIFFKTVDKIRPDIIIQETSTPSFETDLKIAERLSRKYKIALTGPHATAFAEELIKLQFVSFILKGEYEYSSLELVKTKREGIYESIPVRNLDDLPYPYRDEKIIDCYREYNCKKNLAFPQLWIYAGRGCAFNCNFCLWVHTMYNNKFTLREPAKILAEIEDMVSKYNFKYIEFDDDCWNLGGDKRLTEIAEGLHKIDLPWSILCRLDTSRKEIFKYLVDRGCTGLRLGVESLSQRLLDITNKNLKVKKILETIEYLKSLDVSLYLCFMHYIPLETEEDRKEQEKYIKEIGIKYQNPPCIPFPGTPYYNEINNQRFNIRKKVKWREYDGCNLGNNLLNIIREYSLYLFKTNKDE